MAQIVLFCLVLGEDPDQRSFAIRIRNDFFIDDLKKEIKSRKNMFTNVDADSLVLWKVDVAVDTPNDKLTALQGDITNLDIGNILQGTELHPLFRISDYFSQPPAMHIHIVIQKLTGVSASPLQSLFTTRSTSVLANRIKDHEDFCFFDDDLSFLEELSSTEQKSAIKIYDKLVRDRREPNPAWNKEVDEVQPWVQDLYSELAKIFQLKVEWDSRNGGGYDEIYVDHYLTHTEWALSCNVRRSKIDYTKCWAFEDKAKWDVSLTNAALVQCHGYAVKFFENDMNQKSKYVSIITDARNYQLFYAFSSNQRMVAGLTQDYKWSLDTVEILARVFKTFQKAGLLQGNASPRDETLYDVVVKWAKKTSQFPIVTTNVGDIEARRVLGTGSDTVVFEGLTTDNERVAIKYSLHNNPLKREVETLKKLNEIKDIPRLLHEDFDGMIPYIVTSMVGQKVTKIDTPSAYKIMIDILEVLKSLNDHHYIHNDISPSNIVKVGDKFRLIDFGLALPQCDKRDTAPMNWPVGNIIFASHNWGKYLGAGDDLEALCYTVAFMHTQDNEHWHTALRDPFEALHKKEKISNVLCLFDNLPHVFREFFCYAHDLDIAVTPDYEYWYKQFTSTARDLSSLPKKRPETPLESSEGKSNQRAKLDDRSINTSKYSH